jgi:hypothetical protein
MATARGARTAFIQGEKWLNEARPQRFAELQTGYDTARSDLNQGMGGFDRLMNRFDAGSQMYQNALGLGGDEGNRRAQMAFQTGPGFQFAMDQGVKARERAASRMGGLNSGGLLSELTQFGQGLANQEYGNWMNRLAGFDPMMMQGASAQMQTGRGLADLATNLYGQRSNIIGEDTANKIGLFSGAMQATDAARNQNVANTIGGITGILGGLGNLASGGLGGLSSGLSGLSRLFGRG